MKLFTKLAEGEIITRMNHETVYLRLELVEARRHRCGFECDGIHLFPPRRRYGFKIFRYAGDTGPSVRAWWGRWKSKRRLLWGARATPSWEGELLAEEIMNAKPQPWPPEHCEPYEVGEE